MRCEFPFCAREGPAAPEELSILSLVHVAMTKIILPELPHLVLEANKLSGVR